MSPSFNRAVWSACHRSKTAAVSCKEEATGMYVWTSEPQSQISLYSESDFQVSDHLGLYKVVGGEVCAACGGCIPASAVRLLQFVS